MKVVDFNIIVEENTSINKLVSGGLILPSIGTLPMAYGRVIGVGTGRVNKKFNQHVSVNLNVGDLIVYNPGVAKPIKLKNAKTPVFKMKQNEAIMVLEEDGENNVVGIKKVLQNYMLIKRTADDKVSLGGLVMPEIKRSIDNISGTVYMMGPGTYNPETNKVDPCHCNIGDKVSFTEMSSIQITLPVKDANGKITKEKFYEVPDSLVDFVFDTDETSTYSLHVMLVKRRLLPAFIYRNLIPKVIWLKPKLFLSVTALNIPRSVTVFSILTLRKIIKNLRFLLRLLLDCLAIRSAI